MVIMKPKLKHMKFLLLALLFAVNSTSFAQSTSYYRQLRYNHVSPYIDVVGIYPIDSSTASTTSHYVFKYDKSKRLIEIINNHYFTEKVHPLASLGAHRVVLSYQDGIETRTFYDSNNMRIWNDRHVYKEVFLIDENGLRKKLNFYDLANKPMESNWKITEYQWEQSKEFIIERRYNLLGKVVPLSPYFMFGITGIVLNENGVPKGHYNLSERLEIIENNDGVASYQDTYDQIGNHIQYTYHDKEDNLTMNQWGFAVGEKKYDLLGNFQKLILLDDKHNVLTTREINSNASIKITPVAIEKDSIGPKNKLKKNERL